MTIPRTKGHDLQQRRRRVLSAWCQGKSQADIAEAEKVDRSQISRDLDAILPTLHGHGLDDKEGHALRMLGKMAHAESELLAAWERSKKPRERLRAKQKRGQPAEQNPQGVVKPGPVKGQETEQTTEGRDGNPKFMAELRALWELKARLLGLLKDLSLVEVKGVSDDEARERIAVLRARFLSRN